MGVKHLNTFLTKKCKKGLQKVNLNYLRNKTIAVDISIYMYKYLENETLLESIFNMCFRFRKYNIKAVFVFDGKPPKEKKEELNKRKEIKKIAEDEYNVLEKKYKEIIKRKKEISDKEKLKAIILEEKNMETNLNKLKKKFVRLNKIHSNDVKNLINACGLTYLESPCEADVLCSYLIKEKKVYAILSEDTDMFVYGCDKVIRYFSLINDKCVIYDLKTILNDMDINFENFKKICIYSGTDFTQQEEKTIFKLMDIYWKNKEYIQNNSILKHFETNDGVDVVKKIEDVSKLFDIEQFNLEEFKDVQIENKTYNKENIKELLKKELFVFV